MKTWRCEKSHLLMLIYNVFITRFNVTFVIQDMWVILGATYMYARMVTKRFFWLYILFMRLQSFGFNLFGSKSETLPKTVSHHAVFCLFFPVAVESRQTCCHNRTVLEKILTFGRELQNMSIQLRREHGKNETNKKALQASIYAGDV